VKLSDLAIFSLGIHCKGANNADEATVANITSYTFNARGTGELDAAKRAQGIKLKEQDTYQV